MGPVKMKTFLLVLATAVFAQDFAQAEAEVEAPSPRYNCPMMDINLYGYDLDGYENIGTWQDCAHICNALGSSRCKFWTWNGGNPNNDCWIKNSNEGMMAYDGKVSGEVGCTG